MQTPKKDRPVLEHYSTGLLSALSLQIMVDMIRQSLVKTLTSKNTSSNNTFHLYPCGVNLTLKVGFVPIETTKIMK